MGIKSAIGTTCACLSIVTFNSSAAIISADWNAVGDSLVTQDTDTGLEWLDLTATASRSYNDISTKFGVGQEFDGWRYASTSELSGFFDAFGGDNNFYNTASIENNGLFDEVSIYWGDLRCEFLSCDTGDGESRFIYDTPVNAVFRRLGRITDIATSSFYDDVDTVFLYGSDFGNDDTSPNVGHALVRSSVVPVPAAVWLFGSGLLGLIGVARRKVHV